MNQTEVQKLDKEITPFVAKAGKITITNSRDMEKASEALSQINQYADQVKKKKEEVTKPLNATLKAIRGWFAPLEDKLEDAIGSIRKEMTSYQTEQKKIADEEERKIAERVGEGKGKLKVETAIRKMDEIERPEDRVETESGSVKFKTVKKFEVIAVRDLPAEYLLADEVKIRKSMLEGKEITGVRYYTEEIPVNSR